MTIILLSTVAYVALTHGRPVVILGRTSLSGSGASYEISDPEDCTRAVAAAICGADREAMRRAWREHATRLLRHYLFPYSDRAAELMGRSFTDTARYILKQARRSQDETQGLQAPDRAGR